MHGPSLENCPQPGKLMLVPEMACQIVSDYAKGLRVLKGKWDGIQVSLESPGELCSFSYLLKEIYQTDIVRP